MARVLSHPSQPQSEKLVPQIPLTSIVATIGLRKPYAKMEVDESCTVGCLLTRDGDENSSFFTRLNTWNTFPASEE